MSAQGQAAGWGSSPRWTHARATMKAQLPQPCHLCGKQINPGDAFEIDHLIPVAHDPDLTWDPNNWAHAHPECNRKRGHQTQRRKRKTAKNAGNARGRSTTDTTNSFSGNETTPNALQAPQSAGQMGGNGPGILAEYGGITAPRIATPPSDLPDYGDEVAEIAQARLGITLRPWQLLAAKRITQYDPENGRFRHPIFVLTVARRQGKTTLVQALVAWRLLRGLQLFGEEQHVMTMAQNQRYAGELFEDVMREDRLLPYASVKPRHTIGVQEARKFNTWRWRVVAARKDAIAGAPVSFGVVDEAWKVDREPVVSGVLPATMRRAWPQVLLVSTAGDSRSDLMSHFRDQAQNRDTDVGILEWSAPPGADPDDRSVWPWAMPDYAESEQLMPTLRAASDETTWRTEYLNQWVISKDGWVSLGEWQACLSDVEPTGGVAVVQPARDWSAFTVVLAGHRDPGGPVPVRAHRFALVGDAWEFVRGLDADDWSVFVNFGMKDRVPDIGQRPRGVVGAKELHAAIRMVQSMVRARAVAHDGHETLGEHVMRASASDLPAGTTVLRSGGLPVDACEAFVHAVALVTKESSGPVLV